MPKTYYINEEGICYRALDDKEALGKPLTQIEAKIRAAERRTATMGLVIGLLVATFLIGISLWILTTEPKLIKQVERPSR